nr:hypothetical protein [Tanacetum cinerariifolium]
MPVDPFEIENEHDEGTGDVGGGGVGNINSIGTSNEWTAFRDNLAENMISQQREYRAWTSVEDEKLVEALLTMKNTTGYKADNGFKPGYAMHLETLLKEALPDSDRARGKRANDAIEMENEAIKEQEQESENDSDDAIDASIQVEVSSDRSKKTKNTKHANPLVKSFNNAVLLFGELSKNHLHNRVKALGAGDLGVATSKAWVYAVVMTSTGMLVINIESDTSYDYFPAQTTSDEGSDHNPFQATFDESFDHNLFQVTFDESSDDTLNSSYEYTCSSDCTWEQKSF